ncbi:MAG: SDR family NAD(P)-dependent oxidoreductase [Lautropia sp.]
MKTSTLRFAGRVALITGGASGIGLASAKRFVAEGARVVLWDIDRERLAREGAAIGESALCQHVDVTDAARIDAALAEAMARFGQLDIVVNSAGIVGVSAPFWTLTPAQWQQVVDLNLTAIFLVCRAAVPWLMKSDAARIVNLASIAGKEGNANQAAYSATKAGVIGLTKSMGKDLVPHGVLVNAIAPAAIQSEMFGQISAEQRQLLLAKVPMGRPGTVDEAASMIGWLASGECSFSTGATFDLSGGRATY